MIKLYKSIDYGNKLNYATVFNDFAQYSSFIDTAVFESTHFKITFENLPIYCRIIALNEYSSSANRDFNIYDVATNSYIMTKIPTTGGYNYDYLFPSKGEYSGSPDYKMIFFESNGFFLFKDLVKDFCFTIHDLGNFLLIQCPLYDYLYEGIRYVTLLDKSTLQKYVLSKLMPTAVSISTFPYDLKYIVYDEYFLCSALNDIYKSPFRLAFGSFPHPEYFVKDGKFYLRFSSSHYIELNEIPDGAV